MHSLGITLVVDDFSIGYSSLSQLKSLSIYKLKMEQSFVTDLENSNDDRVFVKIMGGT